MDTREFHEMYQVEDTHWWFVTKRMFIQTILQGKKFARILDIGCGTGRNMLMLKQYGRVVGVDINQLALRYCRQRGLTNLKQATAESLPFTARNFDLVTIFDVLYHQGIKSDIKVIKEAFRVLKPGGYVLVTDCAYQWLFGPHDVVMQARQRYPKSELIQKISREGFNIKRASYLFMFTFPIFALNRLLKKYFFFHSKSDVDYLSPWLNQLLLSITSLENKLLKLFNLPFGSSIIILAQK